jgi:hypothetical protein
MIAISKFIFKGEISLGVRDFGDGHRSVLSLILMERPTHLKTAERRGPPDGRFERREDLTRPHHARSMSEPGDAARPGRDETGVSCPGDPIADGSVRRSALRVRMPQLRPRSRLRSTSRFIEKL